MCNELIGRNEMGCFYLVLLKSVDFYVCFFDSEMDSLILESCREFGPSLNTYSRVAQTLKSRSPDEVHLLFHISALLVLDNKNVKGCFQHTRIIMTVLMKIFSGTRRLVVYRGTHCNIGSKRECCRLASNY